MEVPFKLIIAGSRDITDFKLAHEQFVKYMDRRFPHTPSYCDLPIEVVSGGAKGVDILGENLGHLYYFNVKKFPADWDTHGKSAGYRRNLQMGEYADELLAIWDGESKGTKHMIDIMVKLGKPVSVVRIEKDGSV